MVRVLDLLEELLKVMKYKYERLDGSTSSSSRTAAVDRFKRASCQRFVMLLSTRVSFSVLGTVWLVSSVRLSHMICRGVVNFRPVAWV